MILSRETISKRNNLPVELQCRLHSTASRETEWCVKYNGQEYYFNTFEETAEYIRKRKFLSPTKLKTMDSIRSRLLKEAEHELAELDRIEKIRNTFTYQRIKELAEIECQLFRDGVVGRPAEAKKLMEIFYLDEIHRDLLQLISDGQELLPV